MPERVLRLGIDARPAVKGGKTFDRAADSSIAAALGLNKAVLKTATGVAAVGAAMVGATAALGRFAQAGGRQLTVQAAFARRVGDTESALNSLSGATSGLVDDYGLMVQANAAFTLGAAETTAEMALLAEGATKMGRALGLDTAFALESLVSGLARGEREILDNLGLVVSQADANRKYAAALGIAESALTDVQRKEAFRVEGIRQLREQTSLLGPVTLNAGDAFTQLTTEIGNTVGEMKLAAAESETLLNLFTSLTEGMRTLRGESGRTMEQVAFAGRFGEPGVDLSRQNRRDVRDIAALQGRDISGRQAGGAAQFFPRGMSQATTDALEMIEEARERMEDLGLTSDETFEDMVQGVRDFENEMGTLETRLRSMTEIVPRTLTAREIYADPRVSAPAPFGARGRFPVSTLGIGAVDRSREAQEEFAKETNRTADRLGALRKETGDLETFWKSFRGGFDSTEFMSNLGANLASSGISMAIGTLTDALFGPNYETLLQENTKALRNMSSVLREEFFASMPFADSDFAQDLARRARFPADMDLTRRALDASDATPEERFRALQRTLMRNVSGPFAGIIATLNQQNVDEFLETVIASMRAGTFDADALNNLSATQLLDVLAEMEGLADSTGEVADEMDKLTKSIQALNSPSGLNLALLGYNAGLGGGDGGSGGSGGDTRRGGGGTGGGGGTRRGGAAVVINVNGSGSPREVADEVVRRFERQTSRGGPSALTLAAR